MTEYYNVLVALWQEIDLFNTIQWKCTPDSKLYSQMLEKERLNKDLDEVRGRIFGTKPLPTIREVFAEEGRKSKESNVEYDSNYGGNPPAWLGFSLKPGGVQQ